MKVEDHMASLSNGILIIAAEDETFLLTPGDGSARQVRGSSSETAIGSGFDEFDLRPGYTGQGYVDLNGPAGDKASFSFEAAPGTYEVTLRLANGTSQARPIALSTDAGQTAFQDTNIADPDWGTWQEKTFTIAVTGDPALPPTEEQTHVVTLVASASAQPNIDAVAIALPGTEVDFQALAFETVALTVAENETSVGAVVVTDPDDVPTLSIVGGPDADKFTIDGSGNLSFVTAPDFEAFGSAAGTNDYVLRIAATDGTTTLEQDVVVTVSDDPETVKPVIDPVILDGGTGTIVGTTTIHRDRDDESTAESAPSESKDGVPLDAFGLRPGYTGQGYTDYGATDEAVDWMFDVAEAGSYALHIRYAGKSQTDLRPLDLSVNGTPVETVDFPSDDFNDWTVTTVTIALAAGSNIVRLAIPSDATNGPNIDALALTTFGEAANFPPVFETLTPALEVAENETAVAAFPAFDPEGAAIGYALTGPDADAFEIDASGMLTFAAAPDAEALGAADGTNAYRVTVEATAAGSTVTQDVIVTVTDVDEPATALTLTPLTVAEGVFGAVVAEIAVADPDTTYAPSDFAVPADYEVIDDAGTLKLKLIDSVALDFDAGAPTVTVTLGDLTADVTPVVTDVDAPATALTVTPVEVAENVEGAVIATIEIVDPDTTYGPADFTVTPGYEVAEVDGGLVLRLAPGASLDFETAAPVVTVAAGGLSTDVTPLVTDVAEATAVAFTAASLSAYNDQNRPGQGGAGVTPSVDGSAVTLDGNLWQRAAIEPITLAADTVLRVTIEVNAPGEIVGIGFDLDDNPFDADGTLYQLEGSQGLPTLNDLRGTGTQIDGKLSFEIDLSAHAGQSIDSLVLIADDDAAADGLGSVTFSDVSFASAEPVGNADPVVVGGGAADLEVLEGAEIEVDLPFEDADGDALTYSIEVTSGGVVQPAFPLSVTAGTLTGSLGETAPGIYEVTITASDGMGGTDAVDSFLIEILDVNDPPVVDDVAFEPFFGEVGVAIDPIDLETFRSSFTDPEGETLTLTATDLAPGLSVNAEGVVTGIPTATGGGSFTVVATDSGGLKASLTVDLLLEQPATGETITVEAENFTGLDEATGFFATANGGASGDRLIRTTADQEAAITTRLSANGVAEGWYNIAIDVYDELDGSATYQLSVGDVTLTAPNASYDDPGAFTNPALARGNGGQLGNRKTIEFAQAVFVDADTVLTLTGQSDREFLRTDRVMLTRVVEPNEAPEAPILSSDVVAENDAGAVVGTLSAVDPDGDDSAMTFAVDPASPFEVVGSTLQLKAGESLDFEAGASVEVEVTATDAAGTPTTATLTVTVTDEDEAPGAPFLAGGTVDENVAGAVIGTLGAVDPEDGTLTFTVSDPRFVVDGTTLRLADGVALDAETDAPLSVDVIVSDGANAVTGTLDVTVNDLNDAPALADGAALADVATAFGAEARTDLTGLGATDQDAGDVPVYAVRSGTADPLPAGIAVEGTELVVADDVAPGTYSVEVFATDGMAESESVPLTVTVGDAPPFTPFAVQAETGTITLAQAADTNSTTVRDAANPETNGNRPDFTGTGYVDFGNDGGDTLELVVEVPVTGDYDINIRYASQTPRPLDLVLNGAAQATPLAFLDTDADGTGGLDGFDQWAFETRTVALQAGANVIAFVMPAGATKGPNIDRIEITEAGTGPIPVDDTADADGNLALDGATGTLSAVEAASINLNVTGLDADIVKIELSFDGGATRTDVTALPDSDGDFVFDGSALPAGPQVATIVVTDAAGNEATDTLSFSIEGQTTAFDPVTLQAEDAAITDLGAPGTGPDGRAETRVVDVDNPDAFGNFRPGAVGEQYVDFGEDPGDEVAFSVDVPADGTYTVAIRYANGSDETRPLALSVNGGAASNVAFASTVPATGGGDAGWENWTEIEVEVALTAGTNEIVLAIPTAADGGTGNGPNIDQITVSQADVTGPVDAQRFVDVIKVNFEAPASGNGAFNAPAGYTTPDGFESDTGAAYGDRGNGFTYGWVDIDDATGAVTETPLAQPTGSARYKNAAPEASDLQKTYLHFDYPGAPAGNRERAWEIEVANGTYELTVAIGDTAGQYDSTYLLDVEGVQFGSAWEPVNLAGQKLVGGAYDPSFDGEGFRSNLYTGIVQVADGRLTIDGTGGENVEIQWLDLQAVPDLTPGDGRTADLDYSKFVSAVAASTEDGQVSIEIGAGGEVPLDIDPTSDIVLGVQLQAIDHRGPAVAFTDGVKLVETLTGVEVPVNVQITGGADSLTIQPLEDLKEFTSYTLSVEDVLDLGNLFDSDLPQRQFQDYTTTFVTGEAPELVARDVAFTDTVVLDGFNDGSVAITSIEFGPDGKLYASTILGQIKRWEINSDGSLDKSSEEVLSLDYFSAGGRSIIGLAFDPEDPETIWVTDNAPVPRQGKADETPEFSGQISKITLGAGGDFAGAEAETYITGLPRSGGDHVTNSIEFRPNPEAGVDGAPNFLLYFTQGSNSAAGAPDNAWGFRPERLLNAAVLEVDHTRDAPDGGFDVQTEPYDPDTNVPTFRSPDPFNADGTFGTFYDPFEEGAVLKIFGEGVRNAYDLVWHSNGQLYVPTNGTAAGGNSPDDPATALDEGVNGHAKQFDYLFTVEEGGYYGHPNPLLGNYVLNGGNPTAGPDLNGENTTKYPVGVSPDPDYDVDGVYSLGFNKSPNGAVEYTGDAFGENLKGAVLFAQFSQGDNIRYVQIDPVTGAIVGDDVLRRADGDEIDDYTDPLDIVQDPVTGNLYMSTLNRGSGESIIVLLKPDVGPATDDSADEDGNLAISVVDATDASAVLFEVTGIDADVIETSVSFDGGATFETVALDANGQFTRDLSAATGAVTAILSVEDSAANTASTQITFTPGDTSGSVTIDALAFTNLDPGSTIIRNIDDPTTHETTSGNDSDGDGMNDGYDGKAYLDPNGPAGDKASFTFDAAGAGTYSLTFRMAANNDRSVAIQTGTQSEVIAVNTGEFTNWTDYTIELDLADGANTILITQTTGAGPNIDSVTITPVDVAVDDTADEGGDLAIALADASDRAATLFDVTGLDADIVSLQVSLNGGPSQAVAIVDGSITVDTSGVSGDVTVTLEVADGSANVATASVDVTLAATVANDGTAEVNGLTYVLYEAENAALDGAVIVPETVEDRNAQGTGFVDFDGMTDQSITWTIEVAEDGTYAADILYALSTTKQARPMALSVDGTVVETLDFVPNSTDAETEWGPQSFTLDLDAGVHTITVTAPGANGPNVDQFRITQSPAQPGDPDADIEVASLDPTFFENRLHFSWIDDPSDSAGPRDFKESAQVEISNSGTAELVFRSADISGPFALAQPDVFDGLTLAAGESIVLEVLADLADQSAPPSNQNGVFAGALTLRTNDAEDPITTIDLAGFHQSVDEGGQEPNVNEVWQVFGFGNFIEGLPLAGGGQNSVLNLDDVYLPSDETEVLSPYWRLADGVEMATITQIAAFHGPGGATTFLHAPGNDGQTITMFSHGGDQNQSILPLKGDDDFATATFGADDIPDAWEGEDIFGILLAGQSTDPNLNPTGSGTPTQAEIDAAYPGQGYVVTGGTVFDAEGNEIPDGYTLRMFQAVDASGVVIENVFLGAMDYVGINYDYNDNMFVIEGVEAVGFGGSLGIEGLDDAAADDRLVFSAIDNPVGNQETRDTTTFEVTNQGLGALTISGLSVDGAFTATGLAAGDVIQPGGSVTVAVTFDGQSGAGTLFDGSLTVTSDAGTETIALSGLAQSVSEGGQEPTVAEVVAAFGYSTDVSQAQLNGGGTVETVGDEVLLPYLQRLDGSAPVEVINLAAYLQQGDISRLQLHELDDDGLTQLFAGDDQQGQTVLPDGLVVGAGDTGSVGRASIDRDEPFGLKVTVDGRPTFAAWTDPEANKLDPELGVDDGGHYIRFFQAKDATGEDIVGTFIGIQDYPGGGNFDYNDAMFLVTNVQGYDLTADEDADADGINDALQTDADGDGLVAFFDDDETTTPPADQAAFNAGATPWAVDGSGLTLQASQFDTGGQGVAYNDTTPASLGDAAVRPDAAVDISVGTGAVGFTAAGEWLEYTIDVAEAGQYQLSFNSSSPSNGRTLTASFAASGVVYETATAAVANTGAYTSYADTAPVLVDLQAGEQVLRVNFDLNQQDLQSFSLTPVDASGNTPPVAIGITGIPDATEGEAFSFDVSGFFSDADAGDVLTFTATLPQGLSISPEGVITGTPATDGAFPVTVTASDGTAGISSTFTLEVADVADVPGVQAPFPGPDAPVIGPDATFVDATDFDTGGQGVSWNDNPGRDNGAQALRADTDVELAGAEQDVAFVTQGEWVEYTIDVAQAGLYDLSVNAKTPIAGNTVTVSIEDGSALATFALPDSNGASDDFGGTTFAETAAQQVALAAGEQTLRVTFDGTLAANDYLLDYRGLTLDLVEDVVEPDAVGQAGSVTIDQTSPDAWTSVTFDQALTDASVVMGPLGGDGPGTLRVRNVTETGFEVQIDEWDYLDGVAGPLDVQWVALEAGVHEIGGRTFAAGSATAEGSNTNIAFGTDAFDAAPTVFAQVASDDVPTAVAAQIDRVRPNDFRIDLERQQSDKSVPHGAEEVDWIAVGDGGATAGLFTGLAGGVTEAGATILAPVGSDTDEFVFLAQMQSEIGGDVATVQLSGQSDAAWTIYVAEEQSADAETFHIGEAVGYLGLSTGLLFQDEIV
jgi:hypothetical protein